MLEVKTIFDNLHSELQDPDQILELADKHKITESQID
jgi:hypothetical protein